MAIATTTHALQRLDCRWGQPEKGGELKRQTEYDAGQRGSLASRAICDLWAWGWWFVPSWTRRSDVAAGYPGRCKVYRGKVGCGRDLSGCDVRRPNCRCARTAQQD